MDNVQNIAGRTGSSYGRLAGLIARRKPTNVEIDVVSEAIAKEIMSAIAEHVDIGDPLQVQEALRQLAAIPEKELA